MTQCGVKTLNPRLMLKVNMILARYLRKNVDNTSVTIVDYSYDTGKFKLKDLNDTIYISSNQKDKK